MLLVGSTRTRKTYFALKALLAGASALVPWVGVHLLWHAAMCSFAKEKRFHFGWVFSVVVGFFILFFFKYSFSCDFGGFVRLCFTVIGTFLNVLHPATADTYFHLSAISSTVFCL